MTRRIKVLIADDHPPTRAGVRMALVGQEFVVRDEVATGPAAVEAALRSRPDICLLDIHMPGNGIAAARQISSELPDTRIVMLTVSEDDQDLFDALKAGASGYLLKNTDPARLPHALRGVISGEAALPRTLAARVLQEFHGRANRRRLPLGADRRVSLTTREWEVLELLRDGLTTSQIAERLFVTGVTVRTHIASILRKLQVPTREAAVEALGKRL
jgi:DNA-binding NarL/FixJ family response regulator